MPSKVHPLDALAASLATTILDIAVVTVEGTSNGKTLAALLSTALDAETTRITLLPDASGVYWTANNANASATSAKLPAAGVSFSTNKTNADGLQFYASPDVIMTVIQEG